MYGPLKNILAQGVLPTHPRNVFLLTDGAISSPEEVVELIRNHNFSTRFHTFGVGSGASTFLVNETAKAGCGSSHIVQDGDPSLKAKVIESLQKACAPAYSGIQVDWGVEESAVLFQTPSPG